MSRVFFVALFLFLSISAQAETYKSFPVSIPKNNNPIPSSLYLKLNVSEIGLAYDKFKKNATGLSDLHFVKTMDALRSKGVDEFSVLALRNGVLKSDQGVIEYLDRFNDLYDSFENLTVISKVKLKNKMIYIWTVDVKGRKVTAGHFYSNVGGSMLYRDFDSVSSLETMIKQSVVRSFYLPNKYKVKEALRLEYEVELEDEKFDGVGAYLQFNGRVLRVDRLNDTYVTLSKKFEGDKIVGFYRDRQINLNDGDLKSFVGNLTKVSKQRVGGVPESNFSDELSSFLTPTLMHSTILFVLDAAPFSIVFGTNFTQNLNAALEMNEDATINSALLEVPFNYAYLIDTDDGLRFVNVRYQDFVDRVLQENNFFGRKIVAPIVIQEKIGR